MSLSEILSFNKVVSRAKGSTCLQRRLVCFQEEGDHGKWNVSMENAKINKDNNENWCIRIQEILGANDVWEIVEKELVVPENEENLNQDQREQLQSQRKKDQKAIMIIHQCLDDFML